MPVEPPQIPVMQERSSPIDVPQPPQPKAEPEEIKVVVKPEMQPEAYPEPPPPFVGTKKQAEVPDTKMDVVESPKPLPAAPSQPQRFPSPKPSPVTSDHNRGPPSGPSWAPRSPPRGPRNHQRSMPTSQAPASSYQSVPRGPRRNFQSQGPSSSFSSPMSGRPHAALGQTRPVQVPHIPKYDRPPAQERDKHLVDLEIEISKLQTQRAHFASEHFQQVKGLRRVLQELDMATIDLQAAENRRRVADMQLEQAKTGVLGIDAPPTDLGM
ncbi:hypothetical protein BDZ97DRAFT_171101 [Flammula alnicola]|nr:hypothetical protein BDZ97DRAFT_171101 [Flammula alnicola]